MTGDELALRRLSKRFAEQGSNDVDGIIAHLWSAKSSQEFDGHLGALKHCADDYSDDQTAQIVERMHKQTLIAWRQRNDPQKSMRAMRVLDTMQRMWPQHAQETVALIINHVSLQEGGESFSHKLRGRVWDILERQATDGEDYCLDQLVQAVKPMEHPNRPSRLHKILCDLYDNEAQRNADMKEFLTQLIEDEYPSTEQTAEIHNIMTVRNSAEP
jgi:hypothetical protein